MSFSTEVKNELCRVSMQRACCTRAEVYGALLHASVFSHKEIRLSAENMTVVRRLQALLQRAFLLVPLPLVVFPVLYYLCAALWLRNLPAVILMLIFGAAHLTVSIQSFSAPGA